MPLLLSMRAATAVLLSAAAPAITHAGVAVDAGPGGPVFYVKLFKLPHQQGPSVKLTKSAKSIASSFDNDTKSIRVYGRWKLCDGPNFTGTCKTFSVLPSGNHELPASLAKKVSSAQFLGGV